MRQWAALNLRQKIQVIFIVKSLNRTSITDLAEELIATKLQINF